MKIKKCYELRRAGEKIILRHLAVPDYEMKTVLVADEILVIDDFKTEEYVELFILKYGEKFALCFGRENMLSVVKDCDDYYCRNNNLFYCIDNVWSVLTSDLSAKTLGNRINKDWDIFVEEQEEGMFINYYSKDLLFSVPCLDYEVLAGYGIEDLPLDIIKLKTKDGDLFMSLRVRPIPVYASTLYAKPRVLPTIKMETEVIFSEKTFASEVEFYKFANQFRNKLRVSGYQPFEDRYKDPIKDCVYARKTADYVQIDNVALNTYNPSDVVVKTKVGQLYQGNTEKAYEVNVKNLEYSKIADDVYLEGKENEQFLVVIYDGKKEKIYNKPQANKMYKKLAVEDYD